MANPEFLRMVEDGILASGKRNTGLMGRLATQMKERFFPTTEEAVGGQKGPTTARNMSPQPNFQDLGTGPHSPLSSNQVSPTSPSSPLNEMARNRVPSSKTPSHSTLNSRSSSDLGSIDPSNNTIILQHTNNPKSLLKQAVSNKKEFIDTVHSLTTDIPGAKLVKVRTKEPNELETKLARGKHKPSQIPDYIGGRISVKDKKGLDRVLTRVKRTKPVEIDDFLDVPKNDWGYRAIHAQIPFDGMTGEVQIIPEQLLAVQDEMHSYYKRWQNISLSDKNKAPGFLKDQERSKKISEKAYKEFKDIKN